MISYLIGDATHPQADGAKIIVHICNDIGGWGKGFVLALSKRWKQPEQEYRKWANSGDDFQLGAVQFVPVGETITVANMVAQRDIRRSSRGVPPIRYEAVEQCLLQVATRAREAGASVHMPRIGCGLAGGKWEEIEPIIQRTMGDDIPVFVYDLA